MTARNIPPGHVNDPVQCKVCKNILKRKETILTKKGRICLKCYK